MLPLEGAAWSWWNPVRIISGPPASESAASVLGTLKTLIVASPGSVRRGTTRALAAALPVPSVVWDRVEANPDFRTLLVELAELSGDGFEAVLAVGGGSALDTGKALALGLRSGREGLQAAIEGREVAESQSLPLIAVPTTAGTGSEVTPYATLWDHAAKRKISVSGPGNFPVAAILDASLTASAEGIAVVAPGLDAISQACEALWNKNAGPITDALAARSLAVSIGILPRILLTPRDLTLRKDMLEAATLAGLAISRTRTAAAHSISYPLTSHYGVPHGLAASFTLPEVLAFVSAEHGDTMNRAALAAGYNSADDLHASLCGLLRELKVNEALARMGVTDAGLEQLGPQFLTPGRSDNLLRSLSVEQATLIAVSALARRG